jgi:hemolysin activation/secretion protein
LSNLQLSRLTYLPWQMSAVLRLTAQIASAELLPSEQLGAGGSDSVRQGMPDDYANERFVRPGAD